MGNPVFYFIVRKFRGDQIRTSHLLFYHLINLLKARTEKVFELVIDLTQSTQSNEPDVSTTLLPVFDCEPSTLSPVKGPPQH